jgi:hypothetical protein
MSDSEYTAPPCSASGRWRWRVACISSHLAMRCGLQFVDETHGGQAVHYGWPRRSVGIEWSWRHNTWFAGWELWPNNAVSGGAGAPYTPRAGSQEDGR